MSLFPAYSVEANNLKSDNDDKHAEWLSNSSFQLKPPPALSKEPCRVEISSSSDESNVISKDSVLHKLKKSTHKHRKKDKSKRKKHESCSNIVRVDKDEKFVVDRLPQRVYLKVATISRPAVSKYRRLRCLLGDRKFKKILKSERYYNCRHIFDEKEEKDKTEKHDDAVREITDNSAQNKAEDEISQKTAHYNQELGKDPFNVEIWLEYVKFQDIVWAFEKTYRKGSIAKGLRATAERKLAILDKALSHNPGNVILVRERVTTAEKIFPADELSVHLEKLVEKDPGNIILWQGYIEATQCSMSRCNTPAVVAIYNRCLGKLHQLRRSSLVEKSILEDRILCMLYQCGLFLRQAGLWEQLWTLLRLYLVLNLAPTDKQKFNIDCHVNDQHLLELEEVILDSQLPLHELWLRIEKLRESFHWLPWMSTEPCEDPQRTVFIDDVSDLIHPITSTGNIFKLTVTILTLLKMPLLPCRHSTIKQLGLDYVPWALDTVETLLPVYFPLFPMDLSNDYFLKDTFKFAVGPQYLKTHPGQEEYLEFLVTVVRRCGECLQSAESTAIFIWWLRFERLLIILDKKKKFKMPAGRLKKIKSTVKEFLKESTNRNNVLYYREYALIEFELGNVDTAFKILLTAISMLSNENIVLSALDEENRTSLCNLYRTLIELHLSIKTDIEINRHKAIGYLVSLVNETSVPENNKNAFNKMISQALDKYKNVSMEIFQESSKCMAICDHFLPDFVTDWIICHAWLIYLAKSPFESGMFIEEALKCMEESSNDTCWRREVLMEWYASMIYKTCTQQLGCGLFGLFNDVLHRSLAKFPNNLYMLSFVAKEQSVSGCVGKPWWKLSELLSKSGHALPALFLIVMVNQLLAQREADWNDFQIDDPVCSLSAIKNKMLSVFSRLTKPDMCTKRCGLVWRLYLHFLYSHSDPDSCRKVYFAAVEECPWLKALYIDSAIYIPVELTQIQDLIIEKQLRIHVTPEELDVLRI